MACAAEVLVDSGYEVREGRGPDLTLEVEVHLNHSSVGATHEIITTSVNHSSGSGAPRLTVGCVASIDPFTGSNLGAQSPVPTPDHQRYTPHCFRSHAGLGVPRRGGVRDGPPRRARHREPWREAPHTASDQAYELHAARSDLRW